MRNLKRLFYYLLLNILVSAAVTLLVLRWWENRSITPPAPGTPVVIRLTSAPQDTPAAPALPAATLAASASELSVDTLPTPTIEVTLYIVQSGDTLGTIANAYDLTVADILMINDIEDINQLFVGQVIYIPTGPLPTQAPPPPATQTPAPTLAATLTPTTGPLPTATATVIGLPAGMEIITVIGAGDLNNERVLLERTGNGELALAGWRLEDQDGQVFTFPQLTLYENGAVNVYTRLGQNTVVDLFWGLSASVWQPGETVTLVDAGGSIHASFTIP